MIADTRTGPRNNIVGSARDGRTALSSCGCFLEEEAGCLGYSAKVRGPVALISTEHEGEGVRLPLTIAGRDDGM